MHYEWEEEHVGKLGHGVKKDVLTRRDVWYIDNMFYDNLSKNWYVRAHPIIAEGEDKSKYCEFVDFHVTSAYMNKCFKEREQLKKAE